MKNSDVQSEIRRMTKSRKMNNRIEELAEKAGSTHKQSLGVYQFYPAELEKFAKLIVQECLDQCYNRGMNDELYAGQLKAAAYIEEHFGVEE